MLERVWGYVDTLYRTPASHDLDNQPSLSTIKKDWQNYWTKSKLLFGLLLVGTLANIEGEAEAYYPDLPDTKPVAAFVVDQATSDSAHLLFAPTIFSPYAQYNNPNNMGYSITGQRPDRESTDPNNLDYSDVIPVAPTFTYEWDAFGQAVNEAKVVERTCFWYFVSATVPGYGRVIYNELRPGEHDRRPCYMPPLQEGDEGYLAEIIEDTTRCGEGVEWCVVPNPEKHKEVIALNPNASIFVGNEADGQDGLYKIWWDPNPLEIPVESYKTVVDASYVSPDAYPLDLGPDNYAHFYETVLAAAHEVNPNQRVIFGNMAYLLGEPDNPHEPNYFFAALDALSDEAKEHVRSYGVSIHQYFAGCIPTENIVYDPQTGYDQPIDIGENGPDGLYCNEEMLQEGVLPQAFDTVFVGPIELFKQQLAEALFSEGVETAGENPPRLAIRITELGPVSSCFFIHTNWPRVGIDTEDGLPCTQVGLNNIFLGRHPLEGAKGFATKFVEYTTQSAIPIITSNGNQVVIYISEGHWFTSRSRPDPNGICDSRSWMFGELEANIEENLHGCDENYTVPNPLAYAWGDAISCGITGERCSVVFDEQTASQMLIASSPTTVVMDLHETDTLSLGGLLDPWQAILFP